MHSFREKWSQLNLAHKKILVAVSTGCDSMVLLDMLQKLPEKERPQINVAYVDHCLRAQSKMETKFIKQYCDKRNLPLFCYTWTTDMHPMTGVEAKAREMRYNFFAKIMQREDIMYLLTAHHGDDQAETFLMKLIRGGELEQLIGIRMCRPFETKWKLIRPLLGISKEQLRIYAKQHNVLYYEDETNSSDAFQRNRLRHHFVPMLKDENKEVLQHIQSYSEQLNDMALATQYLVQNELGNLRIQGTKDYSLNKWRNVPIYLQKLILKEFIRNKEVTLNYRQIHECVKLLANNSKPQGRIQLASELFLVKRYQIFKLEMVPQKTKVSKVEYKLDVDKWITLSDGSKIGLFKSETFKATEKDDILELNQLPQTKLLIRHRMAGDRLLTSIGKQKVKKVLIDAKIPTEQRNEYWVVADALQNIYWIINLKKSNLSHASVNAKIQYIVVHRS